MEWYETEKGKLIPYFDDEKELRQTLFITATITLMITLGLVLLIYLKTI